MKTILVFTSKLHFFNNIHSLKRKSTHHCVVMFFSATNIEQIFITSKFFSNFFQKNLILSRCLESCSCNLAIECIDTNNIAGFY